MNKEQAKERLSKLIFLEVDKFTREFAKKYFDKKI